MSQTCSIDWTALGTWFLVGTGIAGVIVAGIQLRKLNENERLKNTLELLRRYDSVLVPFMHEGKQEAITAAVAVARCTPESLKFFGSYGQQPPSSDYKLLWASVTIAVNYFKTVGEILGAACYRLRSFLFNIGATVSQYINVFGDTPANESTAS